MDTITYVFLAEDASDLLIIIYRSKYNKFRQYHRLGATPSVVRLANYLENLPGDAISEIWEEGLFKVFIDTDALE